MARMAPLADFRPPKSAPHAGRGAARLHDAVASARPIWLALMPSAGSIQVMRQSLVCGWH
jgi:hypothetical protein